MNDRVRLIYLSMLGRSEPESKMLIYRNRSCDLVEIVDDMNLNMFEDSPYVIAQQTLNYLVKEHER